MLSTKFLIYLWVISWFILLLIIPLIHHFVNGSENSAFIPWFIDWACFILLFIPLIVNECKYLDHPNNPWFGKWSLVIHLSIFVFIVIIVYILFIFIYKLKKYTSTWTDNGIRFYIRDHWCSLLIVSIIILAIDVGVIVFMYKTGGVPHVDPMHNLIYQFGKH